MMKLLPAVGNKKRFDPLEKNAPASLQEMALWKNPGHSLTAFVVLGRVAAMTKPEIMAARQSGDRAKSVQVMMDKIAHSA